MELSEPLEDGHEERKNCINMPVTKPEEPLIRSETLH